MTPHDRAGELIEGVKRRRRLLVSPEGVPLEIQLAGHGERLTAFALDMFFMAAAVLGLYLLLGLFVLSRFQGFSTLSVGMTFFLFMGFIVRNMYFLHFELAWQGRTPGKKICGLRVVSREGGELTPSAVIARNLMREVEVFLPLSLLPGLGAEGGLQQLALFGWALTVTALPLFNRAHLRAGDLIGGTQVIAMPKRLLLDDLTERPRARPFAQKTPEPRVFTHEQLAIYGNLELQVLEEILRRPAGIESDRLAAEVCRKICKKIGWEEPVPPGGERRFLEEFYAAERASLERGQLFGRVRPDKTA